MVAVAGKATPCRESDDAGEGIILEDDTLPDVTFFRFCGEMLDRYRTTTNVMQVSGYNVLSGRYETESDYLFSQTGFSWGGQRGSGRGQSTIIRWQAGLSSRN